MLIRTDKGFAIFITGKVRRSMRTEKKSSPEPEKGQLKTLSRLLRSSSVQEGQFWAKKVISPSDLGEG